MAATWTAHPTKTRSNGCRSLPSSVWRFEVTEAALPKRRAYRVYCSGFGTMLVLAGKLLDLMIIALTRNLTLPVRYR